MRNSYNISEELAVSEMAVVDTFTRLIFNDQGDFSLTESAIIEAFRTVDANVLMDSYAQMGQYLRELGVREMIHLVARICEQLDAQRLGVARSALASANRCGSHDKGDQSR